MFGSDIEKAIKIIVLDTCVRVEYYIFLLWWHVPSNAFLDICLSINYYYKMRRNFNRKILCISNTIRTCFPAKEPFYCFGPK